MKHRSWLLAVLVLILSENLFALGQAEAPPVLPPQTPEPTVLAPANPSAVQKSLVVPFQPQATPGRVLMSWTFTIYDAAGRVVWTQSQKQTKDRGFFGELFNLGEKPRVEVPATLVWDGTDSTQPVPNGIYTYIIAVTDSAGQTTRTPPASLTVQNNPVVITELTADYTVFSPRGKRASVQIRQDGSREARWEGRFTNPAGTVVRTLSWINPTDQVQADGPPPDFSWDGKDDQGLLLPEGRYEYTLVGTNRSGATATQTLSQALVISDRPGVLILSSDQSLFSPKADKPWPTALALKLDSGNDEGLVDWTVTVSDPAHKGVNLWSRSGKAPLPPSLAFDGRDSLSRALADGRYQAVLSANYANGNSAESPPFLFDIDTAAPQGTLKASPYFGGTNRPSLPVEFFGEGNLPWSLDVLGPDGKSVRTLSLGEVGKASVEIPGTDTAGKALADGTYILKASGHDKAGNLGTAVLSVTKDSRSRKITLNPSSPVLVPGNAGNGRITVTPVLEVTDTIEKSAWTLTAVDAKGAVAALDQVSVDGKVNPYDWTGRDSAGKLLADGNYRVALSVTYTNGTVSQVQRDLKIDSAYLREPQGRLTASADVFGGTNRPTVTVKFQGDADLAWTLEFKDPAGQTKGRYPLGTTGTGSVVLPPEGSFVDGTYTVTATAVSKAGVPGSTSLTLKRDTRARPVSLDLSRTVLVPGKGANGQVRITPLVEVLDSIETTSVEIRSGSAVLANRSVTGPLTFWDWNGLTGAGQTPPDGSYQVALTVAYANGTLARAAAELKVDTHWLTEPQGALTVSAPVFGGPARPSVVATFSGDAGLAWTLDVLDKNGRSVRQFALGQTGKATVEVSTDAGGKPLVDGTYTLQASAKNAAGLTGSVTASVKKDSRPLKVGLDLSTPVLVPGNALNGTLKITPILDVLDSVETTTLAIEGPQGPVDRKTWDGLIPFWDWEGRDALGKLSPDGAYRVTLTVGYANGSQGQATQDFKVDSTFLKEPQGTLSATDSVFGGTGRAGVTVTFTGNPGLAWTLEILDKDGKTIRRDPLGTTGTATVDFRGLDLENKPLPDGPYTLKASAVSAAGVPGTALLQLRKDSREGKASVDLSRTVIVPGKGTNGTVRITPILEVVDSVEKTILTLLGPDGKTVGEKSSDGTLPFWDWNGKDAQGRNLANGVYQVALTVNYANGSVVRARSEVKVDSTFLNDQGPLVEMTLSTKTFAPNNVDGPSDLTIGIKTTEGVVPVDSWQMQILDPRGKVFRQWAGKGLPPKSIYWDGKAEGGDAVESGEDYQILLKVSDTQNHITRKQETVTIDISVVKLAEGKYKIVVSSIQFAGYSSDVFKVEGDLLNKNLFVLKRIANALGKFPGYKIRLEGYAVSEFWNDPKSAEKEQKTQLLPLSLDRAQAVRNVMVLLGIDADRFTVQGFGGERPIVPHSDLENRWKNRRVEFYLDKS